MSIQSSDISGVLNQIRALQNRQSDMATPATPAPQGSGSFADLMADAVGRVNGEQQQAASAANAFASGEPGTDLAEVMMSLNKAQVSFKAMAEVRNRLVSSYQDIMNMPI
ncbi:MAG: flagellar hook-basal body complex protein FliE [Oceanococcus sp.]